MRVPDHSTVAEFRCRHERALGELFTAVLALCEEAGLVEVGVISIDGIKIRANALRGANRTYEKLVADILKEAEETDRWEDGRFGPDRGDELPEHLRTEEGRRAAFKAAKERLAEKAGRDVEPEVARIEPDPQRFESTPKAGKLAPIARDLSCRRSEHIGPAANFPVITRFRLRSNGRRSDSIRRRRAGTTCSRLCRRSRAAQPGSLAAMQRRDCRSRWCDRRAF